MTAASEQHDPRSVGVEEKVAFLQQPHIYPTASERVEVIETHLAWVFLTDRHAYKMKKPVCYDDLDFRTVEARQWVCNEEVRLNRRLAGDVYRGVVPLVIDAQGAFRLGGAGEAVDWLVKMQRLPADRMLDTMILRDTVQEADVRRAIHRLADFYETAEPVEMSPEAYLNRLEQGIEATTRGLVQSAYEMSHYQVKEIAAVQAAFVESEAELLRQRVRQGCIVEGHGDLRPQHVCLIEEPVIFDCLEFDRSLRLLDVVDELSFLAMECERLGAPSIGKVVVDTYATVAGDTPDSRLVHFYKSYRALQRAQIAVRHTRRPSTEDESKWSGQARHYMGLAAAHIEML